MKKTKLNYPDKKQIISILLIIFLIVIVFSQLPLKFSLPYFRHYYYLSKSLTTGKLDITNVIQEVFNTPAKLDRFFDYAVFNQKYYLYLGVFPAFIGIPFIIFGPEGYGTALAFTFLILTIILLLKIVKHFLKNQSLLTTCLLFISSPLLTTIIWKGPWHLAGLMTGFWGLMFLWLYVVKKKSWAVFLLPPLVLTRPTTIFFLIIPIVDIIKTPQKRKEKAILLTASLAITLGVFFSYNYFRFDHILQTGYAHRVAPLSMPEYAEFRKEEMFSRSYWLSNAIYMFINPPRVHLDKALKFTFPYFELSRYGVGLLFVIPWFLPYLFYNPEKRRDWPYFLTMLLILFPILSFAGEGSFQIGSRYACDFLPLLFFVNFKWLAKNKEHVPIFMKLLWLSFLLNLYFFFLVHLGHIRNV